MLGGTPQREPNSGPCCSSAQPVVTEPVLVATAAGPRCAVSARAAEAYARRRRMDCFVYVLGSRSRTATSPMSAGPTTSRVGSQHNSGKGARSTRGRAWVLLHSERFRQRREAMSREWHLKRDRDFRKQAGADADARTRADERFHRAEDRLPRARARSGAISPTTRTSPTSRPARRSARRRSLRAGDGRPTASRTR